MFSRDRWNEIFETISKNRLRTFLSGFTVALGIFIFVILFGFGNGLKNSFNKFFMDDATNTLFVFSGTTSVPYKGFSANRRIEFRNDDLKEISENFSFLIEYISPRIFRSSLVKYKNESNTYPNRGVSPPHQFSEKTIMMEGRYLNDLDISNKEKHAVIGRLVALDLFGDEDPLGKYIDMGGSAFKVIGVFQDDGGDNEERLIYIPYTTRQQLEKNNDKIDQMVVAFRPELGLSAALGLERNLIKYLKDKHNIAPDDNRAVFIRNIADQLHQNQQFANVLQLIVTAVGLGTLVAGIIGISNIMVFVVKERTKELGIRKALGATPKSVIGMILHESIFITLIAGYGGLAAGVLLLKLIGDKLEEFFIMNPYINTTTAIFATFLLILFGAIAGYIPAKRAARIKPIIALRDE